MEGIRDERTSLIQEALESAMNFKDISDKDLVRQLESRLDELRR